MNSKKVKVICFSPTGGTKEILENIAAGTGSKEISIIDITRPSFDSAELKKSDTDLVIIGVPVYSGRVPLVAVERLAKITAENIPTALVAVYGNRGYDDALLELNNIAISSGLKPIAASTFIALHTFSTEESPIALSRPDNRDLETAKTFGEKLITLLENSINPEQLDSSNIVGNYPHLDRKPSPPLTPETEKSSCIDCKKCVTVCPTGAISKDDVNITDSAACISCVACVRVCPTGSRKLIHEMYTALSKRLSDNFKTRLEPTVVLSK